ncbi:MAG: 3-oxoacyl-[acyl-carrier protein] reductase [Hyphomicrobiales bacterium]|jgi:3-oxoacyl-[acyl-carrier protein] reductase
MRLQNKIALVTGAGSGFGEGIARTFAREGAKVVIADINEKAARDVAAAIGRDAVALRTDVSQRADVDAAVQAALDFGGLDILVNNAGINFSRAPLTDMTEEQFDRIFAVNVKSIYLFAQAVVPHFRRQGGGVIINIGSTAGLRPRPGLTWYNTSKGAVNLASKSMAVELAPDKIRVCAIAPTIGETGLLASFMGGDSDELRTKFRAGVPLGRLSTPQDVANAALFLASDEADFLTGVVLEVDGGKSV